MLILLFAVMMVGQGQTDFIINIQLKISETQTIPKNCDGKQATDQALKSQDIQVAPEPPCHNDQNMMQGGQNSLSQNGNTHVQICVSKLLSALGYPTQSTTSYVPTTTTPKTTQTTKQTTTPTKTTPTRPPYPPSTPKPCVLGTKADIILVMDASTSIGTKDWTYQTQTAANITRYFEVNQSQVRFAAITFNRYPVKQFDLKDHTNQKSLEKALLAIPYPGIEGTRTDLALALITDKNMFGTAAGGRDGINHLVIVMTDGYSTEAKKTLEETTKLKGKGTMILTVGIGQDISQSELESMASSKDNVIKATSYNLLDYSMQALVKRTCDNAKTAG